jgi:hypothetical protein
MIKVSKGIPIPEFVRSPFKYPWRTMEIGESFVSAAWMPTQASRAGRIFNRKFVVRRLPSKDWRVWRIK